MSEAEVKPNAGKSWQDAAIDLAGPSILPGLRAGDWLKLLWENRFEVHPRYALRAASITAFSLLNSPMSWCEQLLYRRDLDKTCVSAPLFLLGHWRSGTTLLHNLVTLDSRFACPTLCEVLFPNTFLVMQPLLSRVLSPVIPKTRPSDQMRFGLNTAHEDELAVCTLSFLSAHMGAVFPRREQFYDRYLTFDGVPPAQMLRWRADWLKFLVKLTFRSGNKSLVLKSPEHTARVGHILEMFPEAKFVHIHRNPYDVFRSTCRTMERSSQRTRLQKRTSQNFEDRTLRQYKELYDAFFVQRDLIPSGCLHEVAFESLERDPIGEIRKVYEGLSLGEFEAVEPVLRQYAESLSGYRKSVFGELPQELRQRIASQWRRSFEEWGYPI